MFTAAVLHWALSNITGSNNLGTVCLNCLIQGTTILVTTVLAQSASAVVHSALFDITGSNSRGTVCLNSLIVQGTISLVTTVLARSVSAACLALGTIIL